MHFTVKFSIHTQAENSHRNFAQLRNAIFFTIKYRCTCKIKNWICASASVIYMIASKILPCRYEILILLNVVELEMNRIVYFLFDI